MAKASVKSSGILWTTVDEKLLSRELAKNGEAGHFLSSESMKAIARDLSAVYHRIIYAWAQEYIQEAEGKSEEEAEEWLQNDIDGSEWVIYTYLNHMVLLCSDHHDAASEELGEVPKTEQGDVNWPAMAYAAIHADVME